MISVADIVTNQMYANFEGVQIKNTNGTNTFQYRSLNLFPTGDCEQEPHVKEITNTGLLVSLSHAVEASANMQIFDISKKEKARKVFSFEEIEGGMLMIDFVSFST